MKKLIMLAVFWQVLNCSAYCHTGNPTASGVWPQVGMAAADHLPPAGQYVAVTCQPKRGGQNWNRAYIDPLGHWHGNGSMAPVIAWMPIEPYRKAHGKE